MAVIAGQIRHRNYGSALGSHQFAISPDPGQPFADGEVFYAHTSDRLPDGTYVRAGDVIAHVGYEGNVRPPGPDGAHLHLEYHPTTKNDWGCEPICANPQPVIDYVPDTAEEPEIEEEDMVMVEAVDRGVGLAGPGYFKVLTEEERDTMLRNGVRLVKGNARQFDVTRAACVQGED